MANQLKAGSVTDFSDSMAAAIEAAMQEEWEIARGTPMPSGPGDTDRKVMFAAVAKGVLRYLYTHRTDLVTNSVASGTSAHSHEMAFDLREKP
jgi:hypothetical protein